MALLSPGLEIQVSDESTYLPTAQGTVPLMLLATASNKIFNNAVASGTIDANAGKLDAVSSQRELVNKYGLPRFQTGSLSTMLHGDERNEYGLLATYSALGLGNQAFIVRADVDLDELVPSASRPTGRPANGTYWLNTSQDTTDWGIFEWNSATGSYSKKIPLLITQENLTVGSVPNNSYGVVGSYGVVLRTDTSEIKYYYKGINSAGSAVWAELGSPDWSALHPAVVGSIANPDLTPYAGRSIDVNGNNAAVASEGPTAGTLDSLVTSINASTGATGVTARNLNGRLALYVTPTAKSDGTVIDGLLIVNDNSSGAPLLQFLGISTNIAVGNFGVGQTYQINDLGTTTQSQWNTIAGTSNNTYTIGDMFVAATSGQTSPQTVGSAFVALSGPTVSVGGYANNPNFLNIKPTGSVWFLTSTAGNGLSIGLNQYSSNTLQWNPVNVRIFSSEVEALATLDPAGGGVNIPIGTVYGVVDLDSNHRANVQLYRRVSNSDTVINSRPIIDSTFSVGDSFSIGTTQAGSSNYVSYTIVLSAATAVGFVSALLNANIPDIDAIVNDDDSITITHTAGGLIHLTDITGSPIADSGFAIDALDTDAPLSRGLIENIYSRNSINLFTSGAIVSTSTTSLTINVSILGARTLTVTAGLGLVPNQAVYVYDAVNTDNYLLGRVLSYSSTTLNIDVGQFGGTGTVNNWVVTTAPRVYTVGAMRPSSPFLNDLWFDTDNGLEYIYGYNVSVASFEDNWQVNSTANRYFSSTTPPGTPVLGDTWFNTSIDRVYIYRDSRWIEVWSSGLRSGFTASNFEAAMYTFSDTQPVTDPVNNALWYYSDSTVVDIMVNTATGWKGYRTVTADTRGYNLTSTDSSGVIVTPTEPTTQNDGVTAVVAGDIWLDSGDLVNYPRLYRYDGSDWLLIDNSDQISSNGILFADARWGTSGNIDPAMGAIPSIAGLLTSNYIDLDCPDHRLYPRGMLLFNTRRSGFTVKQYRTNYFNVVSFPDSVLPTQKDCWVTVSGLKDDGSIYAGPQAQRNMIVKSLAAAIDNNVAIREDQYEFNLIACPGYPELLPNLIALNNDRANTAFVIGDTPMTLRPDSIDIINWSNGLDSKLGANTEYVGIFYPAGRTTDLSGNTVVVPSSHMVLRSIMRSDSVSFPWFAPAGARRGIIDNANNIGYIDQNNNNEFVPFGLGRSLRDTLYQNRINPITSIPGTGLLVYGQKTRYAITSALDRINVARLIAYIRKALAPIANSFLFEPNDGVTRDQIRQSVEGLMVDLVAKRGLYDYIVICDETNNTPDIISRNELRLDIALAPVRSIEFIYIPLRIRNPGDI